MALIVCTPGGSTDNCYTLRAAIWDAIPADSRERALIQATNEIETLGGVKADDLSPARNLFAGSPYATTELSGSDVVPSQALHFPRTSDVDANGDVFIPQAVRDAVCEQAYWLLEKQQKPDLVDRPGLRAQGVKSFSLDGHSETFGATGLRAGIAPAAWRLIRPYVIQTAEMVRN